ncbi:carotenoid biosynthesis protein [Prolixibacter bellariivorans]|nr:carotenoid biosynthesis protein [Prolixibacter bellariivorans]
MKNLRKSLQNVSQVTLRRILMLFYAVGLIGLIFPDSRPFFQAITPIFLLGTVILLYLFEENPTSGLYVASFLVFAIGFLVEVLGVKTGHVFGVYEYGSTLGPKLFETPLIIGILWLIQIYSVYTILEPFSFPLWLKALIGAVVLVVFDLLLEPAAVKTGMWNWSNGEVPFQNYLAWFITSIVMLDLFHLFRLKTKNHMALPLMAIQLVFFLILGILL